MKRKTLKINRKQTTINLKRKATSSKYDKFPFRVRIAVEYINKNYTNKDLSAEKIAQVVRLKPGYFSSLWNKTTEIGLTTHINNLRIEKAKDLLKKSSLGVEKISCKVGLKKSNFNKVFKSVTGISPSQYRKDS